MRLTNALINTSNIRHNYHQIKKLAPNSAVMAIVKANAYGHGMIEVSKVLESEKIDYLGVAFIEEAVQLRESGIQTPVIILVPEGGNNAGLYAEYNAEPAVSTIELAKEISEATGKQNKIVNIHLYIDTGMTRDGVYYNEALFFAKKCASLPNLKLKGICTHFSTSGSDIDFAKRQLNLFNRTLDILKSNGIEFEFTHSSNSAAIANLPEAQFSLVRPGLAIYGYVPSGVPEKLMNLIPVLELKTKVLLVRSIQEGDSVGYGREFISKRDTRIATIPIGYGDGYFKTLSHKAECLIKGRRFPIVGTVCMDECMVDIGNFDIKIGDEVVLIGKQGKEFIDANELADKTGTIPYEITTSISTRVPRIVV